MTAEPAPAVAVAVIGAAARRSLANARHGGVLAVFRRALYIELEGGDLVCLGPRSLGAGPLNALCAISEDVDWENFGPTPGTPVRIDRGSIEVRDGPVFSLDNARDWQPPPPPDNWRCAEIAAGLAILAATARERAPAEGMGPLLAGLIEDRLRPAGATDPFLRAATGGVMALRDWLVGRIDDRAKMPVEAAVLIGLGPGLTPSGDDFIGGALIGLRYLSRNELADRLAEWVLPLAATRSGKISAAHLACAAAGAGVAALHAMLAAVCAADKAGIETHLAAIDAIGHCSGWDALAGAVCAVSSMPNAEIYVTRSPPPGRSKGRR